MSCVDGRADGNSPLKFAFLPFSILLSVWVLMPARGSDRCQCSFQALHSGNLNLAAASRKLRINKIRVVFIKQSTRRMTRCFSRGLLNTILRWQICFAAAILICYVLRIGLN